MAPLHRIGWRRDDPQGAETLVTREWLVTNGLGGYASGTIGGVPTRRYHGLLVAALPNPLGRTMMWNHLSEQVQLPSGTVRRLGGQEQDRRLDLPGAEHLIEFRLEWGLPVWTYEVDGFVIEKRLVLAHLQNTVHLRYRMLEGAGAVRLSLRPAIHFRSHDAPVGAPLGPYTITLSDDRMEISAGVRFPPLRMRVQGKNGTFVFEPKRMTLVRFRLEEARGYEAVGELWSHGHFKVMLGREDSASLVASTEMWETMIALGPEQAFQYEEERRRRLVRIANVPEDDAVAAELVVAADQFLIAPAGRVADATRARARGDELRTVIAGYHWFTDWGRDTMISLEGLCLATGRPDEARWILNTFAHYVRDGLIPNMFPEGAHDGLYHTADATLWMFHALDRYVQHTGDRLTLQQLLPTLEAIVAAHRRGTRFGIRVDERDGLLVQGHEGLPLTWMDAKCDGWVVTPRRGKAVEVNALWYNALRVLERWVGEARGPQAAEDLARQAARVQQAFNDRFWYAEGGHLYDVVDGEDGTDDPALRPNQVLAIALPNAVLVPGRWRAVVDKVHDALMSPVGLRSLAQGHPEYKPNYHGDLRTRDAAYHQGTVWSWLVGPFLDAWLRVYPHERVAARRFLVGLAEHLGDACVGSVSEVFDAEPPYTARGCVAQAWGVAELLRCWNLTRPARDRGVHAEGGVA